MLKIILIRHGETIDNELGCYCGWKNVELTYKGKMQAIDTAKKLKNEKIDCIISSDLHRTVETAKMINEYHNAHIITQKDLRELHFGLWEGMKYEDIKSQYPHELKNWEKDWMSYKVPKGESVNVMYDRVRKSIQKIMDEYKDKTVLIVAHGGCIRAILAYLIGKGIEDYWRYKIENCKVTIVESVDGFCVLTGLNQ